MTTFRIVDATPEHAVDLYRLIAELAAFEKLSAGVTMTPERLMTDLDGARPRCRAKLAYADATAVGYALFSEVYFSFTGPWTYLDDLYVLEAMRGRGYGKALLASVAEVALADGCAGMTWTVLDWNTDAQRFYDSLGARLAKEWLTERVEGQAALRELVTRLARG